MTNTLQDIRYALRQLRRNPGFALVAVLMLALGSGANTAIFSVINAVLLRPLPYANSDSLAWLWGNNPQKGIEIDLFSPAEVRDLRSQNTVFEGVGAATDQVYNLTNAGDPESIPGYQLSSNFFNVLRSRPILGRTFVAGEDSPGHDRVVILSHSLWQRRFGADKDIVGSKITLNGEPYSVIGVMPTDFFFPVRDNELWTPLVTPPDAAENYGARFLRVVTRLKPGVSFSQAQAEVSTITARVAAQHPDTNGGQGANVVTVKSDFTRDIRPALIALMGAVGFVLLIACANVANLLLARAMRRQGEVAIRASLGASDFRLLRQFLTESLVISLLGGALGLALAALCVNALVAMFPPTISNLNIPRVEHIPIDAKVLVFSCLTAIATGMLFGLAPALRSRVHLSETLKNAGKSITHGWRSGLSRNALVATEIALSLMLLIGAGLIGRSFLALLGRHLGFNPDHVLSFRIMLPEGKYKSDTQQHQAIDQMLAKVRALPGVRSAGVVNFLPLSGWNANRTFDISGRANDAAQSRAVLFTGASAEYFGTMQIPIMEGRPVSDKDTAKSPPVAVISQSMARKYWPNQSALGAQITLKYETAPREIVGVVGDVRHFGAAGEPSEQVYVPFGQNFGGLACFVVRTDLAPLSLAESIRREVWAVDKDQPVPYLMTMDELASESLAPQRVLMFLLGGFAALALGLATIGIYSVMAYSVVERTHEIGVRMALGAAKRDVLRLVLRRGMGLVLIGSVVGLAGASTLSRFLSSMLYGVGPIDMATYVAVSVVLALAACLACYLPARRAARVEPMVALRYE